MTTIYQIIIIVLIAVIGYLILYVRELKWWVDYYKEKGDKDFKWGCKLADKLNKKS